jgi:hypothetical protein
MRNRVTDSHAEAEEKDATNDIEGDTEKNVSDDPSIV